MKRNDILKAICNFEDMENCELSDAMNEDIVSTYESIEKILGIKDNNQVRKIILEAWSNHEIIDRVRLKANKLN